MNRVFDIHQPTRMDLISSFEGLLRLVHARRYNRTFDAEIFRLEMEELLTAINWERAQRDKNPIPMRLLLRRETGAAGHSDYAHKLAIYATELVMDKTENYEPL